MSMEPFSLPFFLYLQVLNSDIGTLLTTSPDIIQSGA